MNILVFGSKGLLGRSLVSILDGHNVYCVTNSEGSTSEITDEKCISVDLSNFNTTCLPENIDAVYYLAQSNLFREFPESSLDILDVNVRAPIQIIEWARKSGVKRFVYASSGGVYDSGDSLFKEDLNINANNNIGFYLSSKLSSEILLRNYSTFFESLVFIRPFFIYGPNQKREMLIPRLIDNVANGTDIMLSGADGIKINPVYVDDAAEACKALLEVTGEHTFNIAGPSICSIKEIASYVSDITGVTPTFSVSNNQGFDIIADISKMKSYLHTPKVGIKQGIMKMIEGK